MIDSADSKLVRGLGLWQATSANVLEMIGVGPFLTIPLILSAMGGPHAMIGWLLGAIIAVSDGLVWAELGAAMPGSGGPYRYLKEAFGPDTAGRMMSFIYLWGAVFIAPLSIASGSVGFAQYFRYLRPSLTSGESKLLAALLCLVAMALLYRETSFVGKLSVAMCTVVIGTLAWVVMTGLSQFDPKLVTQLPENAFRNDRAFWTGLGSATLIAIYDYGGYNNVCLFGGEVRDAGRTIPRSILYAILFVGLTYLVMNVSIIAVIPWQEAMKSTAIVSDLIERVYGSTAAVVMTLLILWTSFASVFAIMLGYSRVPYAAANDGEFFRIFARVHPTKRFPSFSLLLTGITSAAACLMELDALIKALIILQIFIQSIAQIAAVTLIRRNRPDIQRPFRMWIYPVPSILALAGWIYIIATNGIAYFLAGLALLMAGAVAYLLYARARGEWPFVARVEAVPR